MPRIICTLVHAVFLGLAAWLYFGSGRAVVFGWFGSEEKFANDVVRRVVLFCFGITLFIRMCLVQFYLLKRKFQWDELGGVLFALFVYQVCFALLTDPTSTKINVLDVFSIALFVIGSYLNTGSELQRKKFKDNPNNQGLLYTGGLFRYARHINYFGDIIWVSAWAFITRNIWSAIIPVALTAAFIFFFIPSLTKYLQTRYGQQYEEWAKTSKVLIPLIY